MYCGLSFVMFPSRKSVRILDCMKTFCNEAHVCFRGKPAKNTME
jgi:hypothetical protein